jgi:tetratricopeptide (TPR) repeat protein
MEPGDVVADRFELERLAGIGGMGAVWKALDRLSGKPVALKTIRGARGGDAERFVREAAMLADLQHPGIVRYIAHGATGTGARYLVMEWLEGVDLGEHLAKRGALPVEEALAVTRRAADALSAAHGRDIIHRDVKPSNVFLVGGDVERVRLLDFGVARVRGVPAGTQTGMVVGTPGYMAPEQARGERDIDARADVFALGCILYECIAGVPAFSAGHVMALLAKILIEDVVPLGTVRPGVPQAIDRLVGTMLSKGRGERPADAAEVVARLDALAERIPTALGLPTTRGASSLTGNEQVLLCVIAARQAIDGLASLADDATLRPEQLRVGDGGIVAAAQAHGARLEALADGSFVAVLSGHGNARDQASQAARCALAMRSTLDAAAPLALATGLGVVAERFPVGDVIERAVRLLRAPPETDREIASPVVLLDEVTAGLLDRSFDVANDAGRLALLGERDAEESARTLLGHATPCVGREVELRTLEAAFSVCASEPMARVALVTGSPGIGKSRLLHEFIARLRKGSEPVEVLLLRGDLARAGSPFALLVDGLRRAARMSDGEPIDVRRRKLLRRVAKHVGVDQVERVAAFLGEAMGLGDAADPSVQLRAARQDPVLMGDQIRRAWQDFITAECATRALVLVLDDLQWGDVPTIKLVDDALREGSELPLFVAAFARPDVRDAFPNLWSGRTLTEVQLGDLPRKASERLVRHALGESVEARLVARLVGRASGNAFYLEELIRAVADGRDDALPETVLAMVQARLAALEPDGRRVLRAASVFGEVFWRGGVQALLGAGGMLDVDGWVEALASRELVTRRRDSRFPAEQELAFRHGLVREGAYAMLTDADRQTGHRLAAAWLEGVGEADALVLATHHQRGGDNDSAVGAYLRASEQALEANDFAAAIERADRGLACGADGDRRAALQIVRARAFGLSGKLSEDETSALDAMQATAPGSDLWLEATSVAAMASGRLGNVTRLVELARGLSDLDAARRIRRWHVVAAATLARRLLAIGQHDLAQDLAAILDSAEARALVTDDPVLEVQLLRLDAWRANAAADAAAFLTFNRAIAAAYDRMGDQRAACDARANIGGALCDVGRWADAEATLREARAKAEQLGLPYVAAQAAHNLGLALAYGGRVDEGRAAEGDALEVYALKNPRMEGACRIYLALIARLQRDLEEAEHQARAAVERLHVAPPLLCYALAALADVLLARGDVTGAVDSADRAHALLEQLGSIDAGESLVRLVRAETLAAAGREDAARDAVASARDRLMARADRIGDPEVRRSFLDEVPENARTLALSRRMLG